MKKLSILLAVGFLLFQMDLSAVSSSDKAFYEKKCGKCHVAHSPKKYSKKRWKIFVNMWAKPTQLTTDETKKIIALWDTWE